MSNSWFRLYTEFATDPKVQSMPEAMQRRLIMLFCLQGNGDLEKLSHEEIAFALHIDIETFHETFHLFQKKGFCDENGRLINWDKRQFKSDKSTDRVKKYREKSTGNTDETLLKRFSNGDVTPPDTDTDTDTDDIPDGISQRAYARADTPMVSVEQEAKPTQKPKPAKPPKPKPEDFDPPDWVPRELWETHMEVRKSKAAVNTARAKKLLVNQLERLRTKGHDPTVIIENSIRNSWKDYFEPKENTNAQTAANPRKSNWQIGIEGIARARARRMSGEPSPYG